MLQNIRRVLSGSLPLAQWTRFKSVGVRSGFNASSRLLREQMGNSHRSYATYIRFHNRISRGNGTDFRYYADAYRNMNPQTRRYIWIGTFAFGVFFYSVAIEETPMTHRKRLMTCPKFISDAVSEASYRSIMMQYRNQILPQNHPVTKQVKKIVSRLVSAAHDYVDPETGERIDLFQDPKTGMVTGNGDWKIIVIDDSRNPTPNAFVVGNDAVFVFASILKITQNEDALATVLGHELGHTIERHIAERLSWNPIMIGLSLLINSPALMSIVLEAPMSRSNEIEADYVGLMLMSRACYDPREAPKLWRRMGEFTKSQGMGGGPMELLSSHPNDEKRERNMEKWMPVANKIRSQSQCSDYQTLIPGFNMVSRRY